MGWQVTGTRKRECTKGGESEKKGREAVVLRVKESKENGKRRRSSEGDEGMERK